MLHRYFIFIFIHKIVLRLFLASFLKSVGFQISLRQVLSHLFGLPLQHPQAGVSTGSGPTSLQQPTLTYPTDYIYSSILSRAMFSFRTDSSNTSPSSDSDSGLEMKARKVQPLHPAEDCNLTMNSSEIQCRGPTTTTLDNHSTLRHRIKHKGTVLEELTELTKPVTEKTLKENY